MERERMTLRQWRTYRNLTQKEMARRVGVSIPTYRRYEECAAKIQVWRLCKIADILLCSIGDIKIFLGDDSEKIFIDREAMGECEESF